MRSAVPTSIATESVSEVFFRLGRWWSDALSQGLLDGDIASLEGWRVLGALRSGDGFTMTEIATAMGIPAPSLTRIVDKLVDGDSCSEGSTRPTDAGCSSTCRCGARPRSAGWRARRPPSRPC